jgi:DNA-binding NtrC family response regulator
MQALISCEGTGISFLTHSQVEKKYYNGLFCFAGTIKFFPRITESVSRSNHPFLISGEFGTGKQSLVEFLFLTSAKKYNQMISIDCSLLNEKSFDFLLEHTASPLSDTKNVIYFKDIDMLSPSKSTLLLTNLLELEVCVSNLVVFSCNYNENRQITPMGLLFADTLCALSLHVPSLHDQRNSIPDLLNLTLNLLSTDIPHNLAGIEPEAVKILQEYAWPHNFTQFFRIISEISVIAVGPMITEQDVKNALQKEMHIGFVQPTDESFKPIDFNRPLEDIKKEIVSRVLDNNNGNQTLTATQLNISRTTLWRILKE